MLLFLKKQLRQLGDITVMFISVVVTAFNRNKFVRNALESILRQNVPRNEYEIILISNLKEKDLTNFCIDNDIIMISSDGTVGEFLFQGITRAKGEAIAFLDDDDEWEPNKLYKIMNIFLEYPNVCFVHNNLNYFNEEGRKINFRQMTESVINQKTYKDSLIEEQMIRRKIKLIFSMNADFNLSCISIRKSFLNKALLTVLEQIEGGTDSFFFFSAILSKCSIFVLGEPLTKYRVHKNNVSMSVDFRSKGMQVNLQLKTLLLLYGSFSKSHYSSTGILALKMMIIEYSMLKKIWSSQYSRREIVSDIVKLLSLPNYISNPLRWRVIVFSLLGIVHSHFPLKFYRSIRKV